MTGPNPILDAANAPIAVTTIDQCGAAPGTQSVPWFPLGTAADSPTGELFLKVGLVNSGSGVIGATVIAIGPTEDGDALGDVFPVLMGGSDGTNAQVLRTDSTGALALASQGYSSQTTITRPANTTPYTAGDVLGGAIEITLIGPSAGRTILTNLALMPQIAAIPTGMTSFRLHLYNVTPPSALADNAVWDLPSGDRASYLGYIDLGSPADLGSTLFVQAVQVNLETKLASTSVFGYLVTNGGFTPAANSEVYRLDAYAVGV